MDLKNCKRNCIICQNSDLSLFADKAENGIFYKTARIENSLVITLKNNFLAGDAVLSLKGSPCENIILFGSCGGCGNVNIGDLLTIEKAYCFESFTDMLNGKPAAALAANLIQNDKLIKTNAACVSSLLLEKNYISFFKQNGICALDMESSIIISAAKEIGAKASCLFYVSDRIDAAEPVLTENEKKKLSDARKTAAKIILDLING